MLSLYAVCSRVSDAAPSAVMPFTVTLATTGANDSGELKSSTGIVVLSGSSGARRRMTRVNARTPLTLVERAARTSCGPLIRPRRAKVLPSRGAVRSREPKPALIVAVSFVSSPATLPSRVFESTGPQWAGFVSPTIASSAGIPYRTSSDVRRLGRTCTVAMAARLE